MEDTPCGRGKQPFDHCLDMRDAAARGLLREPHDEPAGECRTRTTDRNKRGKPWQAAARGRGGDVAQPFGHPEGQAKERGDKTRRSPRKERENREREISAAVPGHIHRHARTSEIDPGATLAKPGSGSRGNVRRPDDRLPWLTFAAARHI